ncbi:hypothetical protein LSH36_84g05063 [Paralvinella palmiformis]|uniref:Uncharacterized protein n=1 Tax=Paralvinella palmiformis TaxID=53620 RepID=A0AAD9K1E5_9ANNE|nr:hypothetical protein LSH36_84g05063 [Paralvinella palmiformis]
MGACSEKLQVRPEMLPSGRAHKKTTHSPAKSGASMPELQAETRHRQQKMSLEDGMGDIDPIPAGRYTQAQSLADSDDLGQLQPMEQGSIAYQSHASSDRTSRQSSMDQDRLSGVQPDNRLPGTPFGDTGNNSREYTTSIHSPNQPPRDKYGQCCSGHHGAYEPHLVTDEQSDRAHKDNPGRPKERRSCCPKRRPTKNHTGDPTADSTGRSKKNQTHCSPHRRNTTPKTKTPSKPDPTIPNIPKNSHPRKAPKHRPQHHLLEHQRVLF